MVSDVGSLVDCVVYLIVIIVFSAFVFVSVCVFVCVGVWLSRYNALVPCTLTHVSQPNCGWHEHIHYINYITRINDRILL